LLAGPEGRTQRSSDGESSNQHISLFIIEKAYNVTLLSPPERTALFKASPEKIILSLNPRKKTSSLFQFVHTGNQSTRFISVQPTTIDRKVTLNDSPEIQSSPLPYQIRGRRSTAILRIDDDLIAFCKIETSCQSTSLLELKVFNTESDHQLIPTNNRGGYLLKKA
jgi:hypothetical protein